MSLVVTSGLPSSWDDRYPEAPSPARRRWVELGSVWYPGEMLTFEAADASLAIVGAVVDVPLGAARRCPWAICSGAMSAQGFAVAGPHPWSGFTPDSVSPCLFLMFPYYLGDIIGGDSRDPAALDRFVADCEEWAIDNGCRSVAYLYGTAPDEQAAAFARAGYDRTTITQRSELTVSWSDWDGYLASLSSRRRGRVRKERADIDKAGVLLAEESVPEDIGELVELRCNLLRKYGALGSISDEVAMVERVAALRPLDDLTVMTARHEGVLGSYALFVRDGRRWTPILAGSTYSPENTHGYFATVFYLPVSVATRHGVEVIDFGAGAVQAKRLRGCYVGDLVAHVRRIG
jgi:uncharacterized protein